MAPSLRWHTHSIWTKVYFQIGGRLLRSIIGPMPLFLAIVLRIGFFSGIFMFLCVNWAILLLRVLLVFKVWPLIVNQ